MDIIQSIFTNTENFKNDVHRILGIHEASPSRIILLEDTYNNLSGLSIDQDELIRQSLRCVENQLYRAAHVMAWSGFIDFFYDTLALDGFVMLLSTRSNWSISSIDDIREKYTDFAVIEASHACNLLTKTEKKGLQGLLSKRNECAHPSSFFPGINETLGYISELIKRIEIIQKKPFYIQNNP